MLSALYDYNKTLCNIVVCKKKNKLLKYKNNPNGTIIYFCRVRLIILRNIEYSFFFSFFGKISANNPFRLSFKTVEPRSNKFSNQLKRIKCIDQSKLYTV